MVTKDFGVAQIEPFGAELLEESVWLPMPQKAATGLAEELLCLLQDPENRAV